MTVAVAKTYGMMSTEENPGKSNIVLLVDTESRTGKMLFSGMPREAAESDSSNVPVAEDVRNAYLEDVDESDEDALIGGLLNMTAANLARRVAPPEKFDNLSDALDYAFAQWQEERS